MTFWLGFLTYIVLVFFAVLFIWGASVANDEWDDAELKEKKK